MPDLLWAFGTPGLGTGGGCGLTTANESLIVSTLSAGLRTIIPQASMGDIVDHSLLLTGAVGALICEYIVAIVAVDTFNLAAQKVFIAFMCIYIALFAATWGPITRIRESFHST
ncbi:hypothetical protein FRB93_000024 [Tulasnella sp. JGI-2019a]|nr:hypothetical protein FRB93_000024 [Tulasnella sp. JGI-2019a]